MNSRPLVSAAVLILSSLLYGQTSPTCLWSTKSDPAALIESCSNALESSDASAAARAKLLDTRGRAYLAEHDDDKAVADLNQALTLSPSSAEALTHRGMVFTDWTAAEEKRDYARAIADFNEALRLEPNDVEALLNRGMALENQTASLATNQTVRDAAAARGQQDFRRAIQLLNDRLAHAPKNAELLKYRGWAYHASGDEANALKDLEASWKADPHDPQTALLLGDSYWSQDRLVDAVKAYTAAIKLRPDANSYRMRAQLLLMGGASDAALQDFNEALRLRPDFGEVFAGRGSAYAQLGHHDKAIDDYTAALRLAPHSAELYYDRGVSYGHLLQYDKAIADYNQAISLNPDFAFAYNARGNAYRNQGEYRRSILDYDKALSLKPDLDAVFYNRGRAYSMAGLQQQALADFDEYAKRAPEDMDTYEDRGFARFFAGRFSEAAVDLEKALQNSKNPYDLFFLYLSKSRAGQDGMASLRAGAGKVETQKWSSTVLAYLLGQIDQETLLEAAKNDNARLQSGQLCEAYFYLGERALLKSDMKAAEHWFSQAEKTGSATYVEYRAAESELERVGSETQPSDH